ncbi:MAG: 6-carboxytetrahydropterin synthase [Alphaproteobacteria bacterium]|nr:6-carboxytetrahydropterin synthase [Alphaproteobacteria bacterium]
MFSVTVSDSVMIAHSLKGDVFGPAQRLHGATYVVEVQLRRDGLDGDNIVADIGRARALLAEALAPLAYRNLDELPDFSGVVTTTEFLAQEIFRRYRNGVLAGRLGGDTASALGEIEVTLRETPNAWASYRGPVRRQ